MNIILLSGGSGERLWPLSSEQRSKQFIPLFKDETNRPMSMLQKVWGHLQRLGLHRSAIVAASARQQSQLESQLGDEVDLVLEPDKRDTFPAILLAVAYLYTCRGISREEYVAVMPVDGQVEGSFYDAIQQLPEALDKLQAKVALLGVKPAFPTDKYGYLLPEALPDDSSVVAVRRFCEKPSVEDASRYIAAGALWNCGVFCFKAGYILDMLKALNLPTNYDQLLDAYSGLERRSFDYAVLEKETRLAALVYDGPWKDLGTWCALTEEMSEQVTGNGFLDSGCSNVHIVNELESPVLVLGLSDIVVAASRDGILVTQKGQGSQLKAALSQLKAVGKTAQGPAAPQQVVTLDRSVLTDGTEVTARRIQMSAGEQWAHEALAARDGKERTVTWSIVHGSLRLLRNGEESIVPAGSSIVLGHGDQAQLQAMEQGYLIEIARVAGNLT